jgi:hypothetical protein
VLFVLAAAGGFLGMGGVQSCASSYKDEISTESNENGSRSEQSSDEWTEALSAASLTEPAKRGQSRAERACPEALKRALGVMYLPHREGDADWRSLEIESLPADLAEVSEVCADQYATASERAVLALECQADADTLGDWLNCRGWLQGVGKVFIDLNGELSRIEGLDPDDEAVGEEDGPVGEPMEKRPRYDMETASLMEELEGPVGLGGIEGLGGLDMGDLGAQGGLLGEQGGSEPGDSDGNKGKAEISVLSGQAIVMGVLDKSLIDMVIKRNKAKFLYCYQPEMEKDPSLHGKVTLNFTISGDGSVSKSSTYKTTLNNETVEACLNEQMKRIRFPTPEGGAIVIVKYPFAFSAG